MKASTYPSKTYEENKKNAKKFYKRKSKTVRWKIWRRKLVLKYYHLNSQKINKLRKSRYWKNPEHERELARKRYWKRHK